MILKYSLKSIVRTPKKTALFLFLLISLTIFLNIGAGMYDSAKNMLLDADHTFTTIAQLDVLGDIRGEEDISFYEQMNSELEDFDFVRLERHPSVKTVNRNKTAWAYMEGETIRRFNTSFYDYVIVKVYNITKNDEVFYTGIVSEGVFGKRVRENAYITINGMDEMGMPLDLEFDKEHEYLLVGPVVKMRSPMLYLSIRELEFAKDIPYIVDLTENPDFFLTEEGKQIQKLQEAMEVVDNSYQVTMVSSLEASSPYYFNELLMKEGRIFDSSEYEEGKDVILISEAMAKSYKVGVGDRLHLKLHYNPNGFGLSHFVEDNQYDYESGYEVVGIFEDKEDSKYTIYMPEAVWLKQDFNSTTIARYMLINGQDEKFIKDNEEHLLPNMEFTIYDQGYKEAVKPIIAMKNSAIVIILLGTLSGIAILVLFAYLYIIKQKDTLRTMLSLGTSKGRTMNYILIGSMALVLCSSVLGSLITFGFLNKITEWLFESMLQTYSTDLRYSERAIGLQMSFVPQVSITMWLPVFVILAITFASLFILMTITYSIFREEDKLTSIRKNVKRVKISTPRYNTAKKVLFARVRPITLKFALISLTRSPGRSLIIPILSLLLSSFIIFLELLSNTQQEKLATVYEQMPVTAYMASLRDETRDIGGINLTYDIYRLYDPEYSYRMELNYDRYQEYLEKGEYTSLDAEEERNMLINGSKHLGQMQLYSAAHYEYMGIAITKEGVIDEGLSSMPVIRAHSNAHGYDWFLEILKKMPTLAYADDIRYTPDFFKDTEPEVEFLEGYDLSCLRLRENIGIISRSFADENNIQLGDTIRISAWSNYEQRAVCSIIDLKVVGIYEKSWRTETLYLPWIMSYDHNYYLDYEYYMGSNLEGKEMWNEIIPRSIRAATFTLRNTKELSEFRDYLETHGYSQVGKFGSNRRVIVIQDKHLVETAQSLKNHIRLIDTITPIMLLLFGVIGYGVSYLLMKHRVNELAIMRSMGAKKYQVFFSYLLEQLILFVAGLLPVVLYTVICPAQITYYGASLVYFILCYYLGTAIALGIMNRAKIMEILFSKE